MIKSAYRLWLNDQVFCFDEEGKYMRRFDGKFQFLKNLIMETLAPDAEFFMSGELQGNWTKITQEQWFVKKEKD